MCSSIPISWVNFFQLSCRRTKDWLRLMRLPKRFVNILTPRGCACNTSLACFDHTFHPPSYPQELQRRREEELASLQDQLATLTAQLETLDLNMRKYMTGLQQMVEEQSQQEIRNKEEEEAYRVKKKTFDLLPNAEENIVKLQVHSLESSPCLLRELFSHPTTRCEELGMRAAVASFPGHSPQWSGDEGSSSLVPRPLLPVVGGMRIAVLAHWTSVSSL